MVPTSFNRAFNTVRYYGLPIVLLCLAWSNINSGYWNLERIETPLELANGIRALMPYVLPLVGLAYWSRTARLRHRYNPVAWLTAYGFIALAASALSQNFEASTYFGLAFMMNVLIPCTFFFRHQNFHPEIVLLTTTWLILSFYVLAIYVLLGDQLSIGYGIEAEIHGVTRSSGLARFFGVAALLCFARIWQGTTLRRYILIVPFSFFAWVVWTMQSRGGMFGFFAGMILLFFLSRASWRAYVLTAIGLGILSISGQLNFLITSVTEQVTRGQDLDQLRSLTGRTHTYAAAWEEIGNHPIIGQGNWADRLTIGQHVHNSLLQALLNAGILGFVPYLFSWWVGWWLFARLYKHRATMSSVELQLFMEAGAVMMFFTVRSIPETTTASFSVDSMLMIPIYLYLFALHQRLYRPSTRQFLGAHHG